MGLYTKLKELEQCAIDSGDAQAIGYAMQTIGPFITDRMNSYEHAHCDLTTAEIKTLLKMNGASEDAMLVGGDIYAVVDKSLKKVGEVDLFVVMEQIQQLIKRR